MAEDLLNRLVQVHSKWQESSDYLVFCGEEKGLFEGFRSSVKGAIIGQTKWPERLKRLRIGNFSYKQDLKPGFQDYMRSRPVSVRRFISPSERELSLDKENSSTKGKKCPHPRSISVDPAAKRPSPYIRRFTDLGLLVVPKASSLPEVPKGLAGKAVALKGRLFKGGLGRFTAKSPLQIHCPNPMPEADSPLKRNYQRLLRKTLKQIENENIEGWA